MAIKLVPMGFGLMFVSLTEQSLPNVRLPFAGAVIFFFLHCEPGATMLAPKKRTATKNQNDEYQCKAESARRIEQCGN
jgi:hypothetical protein